MEVADISRKEDLKMEIIGYQGHNEGKVKAWKLAPMDDGKSSLPTTNLY